MILVNLCRSIKKSNFNNNIMYNSSSIYEYWVFLQPAFRKLIQYEKENTYHSP